MANLITKKTIKILIGIKEVFVYFDNSAICQDAQEIIQSMLTLVEEKPEDKKINTKKLLADMASFNDLMKPAFEDSVSRTKAYHSKEQAFEKEAVCRLIEARSNTLIMILKARV